MIVAYYANTGRLAGVYKTSTICSRELGVDLSSISRCIHGKLNQTKGYCFLLIGEKIEPGTIEKIQDYVKEFFNGTPFQRYIELCLNQKER